MLAALKAQGKRMPGYGHRLHTADPRTARLRELAREAGVYGKYLQLADAIEAHFAAAGQAAAAQRRRRGGRGAVRAGRAPEIGNGFFILPRVVGLIAHFHEESHARESDAENQSPSAAARDLRRPLRPAGRCMHRRSKRASGFAPR